MSSTCVLSLFLDSTLIISPQTELVLNTHTMVVDLHRNVFMGHEGTGSQYYSVIATFHPLATEC